MARRVKWSNAAVALLVACSTTTEPVCGCLPPRTSIIVYGAVLTPTGLPMAGARLRFAYGAPHAESTANPCTFDSGLNDTEPSEITVDSVGRFRRQVFSIQAPAIRCLRVTAYSPAIGSVTDSARIEGVLVPLRFGAPDSVGVVLKFR